MGGGEGMVGRVNGGVVSFFGYFVDGFIQTCYEVGTTFLYGGCVGKVCMNEGMFVL